jgi:hypothetical protein
LQTFKVRLDEVEHKVDVLEIEVKELELASEKRKADEIARTKAKEEQKAHKEEEVAKASDNAFLTEWPIVRKVLSGLFGPSSDQPRPKYPNFDPQTLSQLPPYVLLVSLGMCAVVLRVVTKRLGGRR